MTVIDKTSANEASRIPTAAGSGILAAIDAMVPQPSSKLLQELAVLGHRELPLQVEMTSFFKDGRPTGVTIINQAGKFKVQEDQGKANRGQISYVAEGGETVVVRIDSDLTGVSRESSGDGQLSAVIFAAPYGNEEDRMYNRYCRVSVVEGK